MDKKVDEILKLLKKCTLEQCHYVFRELRSEFKIHVIEEKLNINAEIILEAINKDASGLTFRMLRGVIAESALEVEVLKKLKNWEDITPSGDLPYDFLLRDAQGSISIQVKLQRSVSQRPMLAKEANKAYSENMYVAETQKTRGGKDSSTSEDTRPYRFNEFDILAVCMQPSTGSWSNFMFTVSDWLLERDNDSRLMQKFQPISMTVNDDWTNDFETAVCWYRGQIKKKIKYS